MNSMSTKMTPSLCLLLVSFLVVMASASPHVPTLEDIFDVEAANHRGYAAFMSDLDFYVNKTADRLIERHPFLRRQTLRTTPAFWIKIVLKDASNKNRVSLAIRSDNLYISGFSNKHGEWFAFKGQQNKIPSSSSTQLSFTGNYRDLLGNRAFEGLEDIPINKTAALAHLLTLANYRAAGRLDKVLKIPLAFFILTICEAERFVKIREAVIQAWDAPTPQKIIQTTVSEVVNWAKMSCALLAWDTYGRTSSTWAKNTEAKELRLIGIKTPNDALSRINPILWGSRCSMTH